MWVKIDKVEIQHVADRHLQSSITVICLKWTTFGGLKSGAGGNR